MGCTDYWPKAQRAGFQPMTGLAGGSQELDARVGLNGIEG